MLTCICGYECADAEALDAHLARYPEHRARMAQLRTDQRRPTRIGRRLASRARGAAYPAPRGGDSSW